jgi:hypothetical protein
VTTSELRSLHRVVATGDPDDREHLPTGASRGLGNPAGVTAGIIRGGFDRRRGERLGRVGQQLSRIVGHRLFRIDERVRAEHYRRRNPWPTLGA